MNENFVDINRVFDSAEIAVLIDDIVDLKKK